MADKWDTRTCSFTFEFTDEENAKLEALSAQAGLTVEEFIRTLFGFPP